MFKRSSILAALAASSTAYGFTVQPASSRVSTRRFVSAEPKNDLFIDATQSSVKEYYGKTLKESDDLATNACCAAAPPPQYIKECIDNIHPQVKAKYYGCGLCLPQYDMTGLRVLDLGCGAGRDVYIASQLVGPTGKVVGVDMTDEQLETARMAQTYHEEKVGYNNVQFLQGYLENLDQIEELKDQKFDVIISNCVINLCSDKEGVLRHCFNLLEEGGEFYFSDVYANRRVPQELQDDPVLWGECLSGALYWNDFENLARTVGFDPRLVEDAPITVDNPEVQRGIAEKGHDGLDFYSATYRLWKLLDLEPACEDYGQAVIYRGSIPRYQSGWLLDKHHYFEAGRIKTVCGNTWKMLHDTCLKDHFEFIGNFDKHYGIFEGCGSSLPYDAQASAGGKGESTKGSCC